MLQWTIELSKWEGLRSRSALHGGMSSFHYLDMTFSSCKLVKKVVSLSRVY